MLQRNISGFLKCKKPNRLINRRNRNGGQGNMRHEFYDDNDFYDFNSEEREYNGLNNYSDEYDSDSESDLDYDYDNDYDLKEGRKYQNTNSMDSNLEYDEFENSDIGKLYSPEEWEQLINCYKNGTPEEKEESGTKVYCAMMPFIKFLAKKFYSSYMPRYTEDLESAGKIGLFSMLADYDPKRSKPTTWFYRSIVHEMRDFIAQEVHGTTPHYQKHLREINKFINDCKTKGISYTIDDIMIATDYPKQTIVNCMMLYERNQNSISADQTIGDSNLTVAETIASENLGPEDIFLQKSEKEHLLNLMNECLSETEKKVALLHYGFFDDIEMSSSDIAKNLSLKKQDIRPIINMAERKLRFALKKEKQMEENAKKSKTKSMFFLKTSDQLAFQYEFEILDME